MSQERGLSFLEQLSETRHELPYSPEILEKFFDQAQDSSRASMEDIATTIGSDQGLTTRILTLANSAFYGLQSQVTSLSRALAILGIKEIRNIFLAICVQSRSQDFPLPEDFNLNTYWEHQIKVATAAKALAEAAGDINPDDAYTAGLLHDLGKLVSAMHANQDWQAIQDAHQEQGLPYVKAEESHWGIEHGVIGALIMRAWNLPPELAEPVNWHHSPRVAPEYDKEAALIGLADTLVHICEDPHRPVPDDWPETAERLGLEPHEAHALVEGLEMEGMNQFISNLRKHCPENGADATAG
jgi:putative nucleotidyltransferase with HDIG domain